MLSKVRIVLVEPSHPGNIGATARAMKNMGLSQLFLVSPKTFPHADATSRASGADDVLAQAVVCQNLDEAISGCHLVVGASARLRRLSIPQWNPRQCAENILTRIANQNPAIVFGREHSGLTNEEVGIADILVSIPANPEYPVFNISHAVAIVLYELTQTKEKPTHIHQLSSARERNLALDYLTKSLPNLGIAVEKRKNVTRAFKNLFGRSLLSQREVTSIIGYFNRVYKNTKATKSPLEGVEE